MLERTEKRGVLLAIQLLCIIFLFLSMEQHLCGDSCFAQPTEQDEISFVVRPLTPILSNTTPTEYRFETSIVLSKFYLNQFENQINLTISEDLIGWGSYGGFSVQNISLFDNLGNTFEPVIRNGFVSNPETTVTLPPLFEYKLSLSLYTEEGITFDDDRLEYSLQFDLKYPNPAAISIELPSNFTILAYNIYPDFSPQVSVSEGQTHTILRWDAPENVMMKIYVSFWPFRVQGTIRSYEFIADIPSVFPVKGGIRGTFEQVFQTSATFSIWEINPIVSTAIDFPKYLTPITVENVWDCDGECERTSEPIDVPDDANLGHYYVDNANRKIVVYPRHHQIGDVFEYKIGATFFASSEFEPYNMEGIREKEFPFRYESYFIIENIILASNWEMNLTGDVEVKFILPEGTEILTSESGDPLIDVDENRPVARFIYNSPKELFPSNWRVIYDLSSLKNFFVMEAVSICILCAIFAATFRLPTKIWARAPPFVASIIIAPNLHSFISLNAFQKTSFVGLFLIEAIAFTLILIASIKRLRADENAKAS